MVRYLLVALLSAAVATSSAYAQGTGRPLPDGWTAGPTTGQLGERATISVPDGYLFLDSRATMKFLEEGQNLPNGDELGAVFRPLPDNDYWFAVFNYDDTGHVDDSERNTIDAAALMKTLKEGNKAGNEERQRRGWETVTLEGWHQQPYYDQNTAYLTWSTILSSQGSKSINHSVRLLGRTGTMRVQLVAGSDSIDSATREFNDVLRAYSYNPGQRYAEFRKGDKLAGYGLTALIAGGVGAAAVKTGILQKLWKFIVFAIIAAIAALRKLSGAVFGRKEKTITEQYMAKSQNE